MLNLTSFFISPYHHIFQIHTHEEEHIKAKLTVIGHFPCQSQISVKCNVKFKLQKSLKQHTFIFHSRFILLVKNC